MLVKQQFFLEPYKKWGQRANCCPSIGETRLGCWCLRTWHPAGTSTQALLPCLFLQSLSPGPKPSRTCCSKCGLQSSSIGITWGHVRDVESRIPPQIHWIRICIFTTSSRWFMSTLNEIQEALIAGACRNVHQMARLQQALAAEPQSGTKSPLNSTVKGIRSLEPSPTNCGKHEWESEPRGEPYSVSAGCGVWAMNPPFSGLTPGVSTCIV